MDGSKDLARGPGSPFPGFSARFLGFLGFLLVVPAPAPHLVRHNHTLFANVYFNNVAENFYFQFFTSQWSLTSHQAGRLSVVPQWESMGCEIIEFARRLPIL